MTDTYLCSSMVFKRGSRDDASGWTTWWSCSAGCWTETWGAGHSWCYSYCDHGKTKMNKLRTTKLLHVYIHSKYPMLCISFRFVTLSSMIKDHLNGASKEQMNPCSTASFDALWSKHLILDSWSLYIWIIPKECILCLPPNMLSEIPEKKTC